MTVFVAVLGAAPGVGKSTLCTALAASFPGLRVDHFREEEILTRPAFASVAAEFRTGEPVRLETLLQATRAFVATTTADVVIADALFPDLPSLRAWGYPIGTIAEFLAALRAVVPPVVLYLDADPAVTLPRAVARERAGWADWFVGKLAGRGVHDLAGAAAYLVRERELTLRLLADWDVHVLAEGGPDAVRAAALSVLRSPRPARRDAGRPR